jgi:Helicase associated domain
MDFDWQGRLTRTWDENFALLVEARRVHETCHFPKSANPSMYNWLHYQRERQQAGMLAAEQRARLATLGCKWAAPSPASATNARHQMPQAAPPEVSPWASNATFPRHNIQAVRPWNCASYSPP